MKTFAILAAVSGAVVATPASAASYAPVTGGAPNTTNFQFGYDTGGGFTQYGALIGACPRIAGTSCYLRDANNGGDFLGAYFVTSDTATQGAFLYSSDATLHPGPGANEFSVVRFVAPNSGLFNFAGFFRGVDANGQGNGVIVTPNNGNPLVTNGGPNNAFNFNAALTAGQFVDFRVGNNGGYGFDTTGLNLLATSVPEPSTWGMMILGFGVVGGAARYRRRSVRVAVAA